MAALHGCTSRPFPVALPELLFRIELRLPQAVINLLWADTEATVPPFRCSRFCVESRLLKNAPKPWARGTPTFQCNKPGPGGEQPMRSVWLN